MNLTANVDTVIETLMTGADSEAIDIVAIDDTIKGLLVTDVEKGKELFISYRELINYMDADISFTPVLTELELQENLFNAIVYEIESWAMSMKPNTLSLEV